MYLFSCDGWDFLVKKATSQTEAEEIFKEWFINKKKTKIGLTIYSNYDYSDFFPCVEIPIIN